jgi:GT2 family glycosyltransferase
LYTVAHRCNAPFYNEIFGSKQIFVTIERCGLILNMDYHPVLLVNDKELTVSRPGIALLHYNKIRLTKTCLDSLLAAGVDSGRIVCLDNGSDASVVPELQKHYSGVTHHRLEENRGFSGGFNAALKQVFARGYLSCLFLTNDTVYHVGADQILADALEKNSAGMAAPCIRYAKKPEHIDSFGAFFNAENASLGHYHEIQLPLVLDPMKDYIPGTALAMTAQAFDALEGADESFHTYWEDVDMCFRAHHAGIPLIRCSDARIDHGVGKTCHKKPFYTTWLFQRNRLIFCRRYLSGTLLENAEICIRTDWQRMVRTAMLRNDPKRLSYISELLSLLDT